MNIPVMDDDSKQNRLLPKPAWVSRFEVTIASRIPIHPNIISAIKLVVVTPILVLALRQVNILPASPTLLLGLFSLFALLDYLDGIVARQKGLETSFGRVLDRLTDYPILVVLALLCLDIIPTALIIIKLGIDLLLMALYLLGRGSTENRTRTAISYTTLLCLMFLSQGWSSSIVTPKFVIYLFWINIAFSSVVALYNLRLLQKRFIADALSAANLLAGIFSMMFSMQHRVDLSLLFLMLGAAFDGFDGAAARRWGGTRWGVYSDDVADGVNYGIAPGVALYFALGGIQGLVVGIFYSVFTISRLVFFTLNKSYSDPNYFSGVPSTIGAIVVLCSLLLFENSLVLLGFMVGIACVQMVSFDTNYRHLGRALSSNRRIIYGMPVMIIILIIGRLLWHEDLPFVVILGAALVYGFMPTATHFITAIRKKADEQGDAKILPQEEQSTGDPAKALIVSGKIIDRLGHLSVPLGIGILIGFYFADQEMRFLPTAFTIALVIFVFGFAAIPLGRAMQGRAFNVTPDRMRIRKSVVFFGSLCSIAVVLRLVVFWTEVPSPLTELTEAEFNNAFEIDSKKYTELNCGLASAVRFLEKPNSVFDSDSEDVLLPNQEKEILETWNSIYDLAFSLDQIRDFYKDWYRFDPSRVERRFHLRSFLLSFAAEISLFEKATRVVRRLEQNPNAVKFLDTHHPKLGLGRDTFSRFRQELLGSREEARILAGKQYLGILEKGFKAKQEATGLGADILWRDIEKHFLSVERIAPIEIAAHGVRADLQAIKRTTRRSWFSTQKSVALWMGDTRVRRIGNYLITKDQQEQMDTHLSPGDILLTRKNWYLSNVGLPGFWPHAILYIGSPSKFDAFFDTPVIREYIREISGHDASLGQYIKKRWPGKWAAYQGGEHGDPVRVIEAISEGVIFNTLSHTAGDYMAAVRPKLDKKAKAQAIIEAFSHQGKPYDFDFDFATDHALVCTELVWRSYRPAAGKDGINFSLVELVGRRTLPANNIAMAYADQARKEVSELEFVYFIDANEKEKKAFVSTEKVFKTTSSRTKWDLALP